MSILQEESNKSQNQRYKLSPTDIMLHTAATAGTAYGVFRLSGHIPTPVEIGNLRFLAKQTFPYVKKVQTGPGRYRFETVTDRPWYEALGKTSKTKANVRELMLNSMKAAEEQLFRIPRAFSFYGQLSTGYLTQNLSKKGFHITKEMIPKQSRYLDIISQGAITEQEIKAGLLFKDGKLWSQLTGEELLGKAHLNYNYWNRLTDKGLAVDEARKGFASRVFKSLYRMEGLQPVDDDILISGGRNIFSTWKRRISANVLVGVENYMKLLDDPFEALLKPIESALGSRLGGFAKKGSRLWNTIGARNLLGVGGWEGIRAGGGAAKLLQRHALRGLPVIALAAIGLPLADEIIRNLPGADKTIIGGGLKGSAAALYQKGRMGYSRISDITGLTAYSKWQEDKAPGSTSLKALGAPALSLAIGGATAGGIMNLIQKTPIGEKVAAPGFYTKATQYLEGMGGFIGKAAKWMDFSSKGRVGSFALMGTAAGIAMVLPMLGGAIGSSKSTEELAALYSGQDKVPVRYGQRWEFGITPFEGGDIKYYRPDWTVGAITDAAKKSKFGKFYGKPLERLFRRMMDPYFMERELDEERPYQFWGPTDYGLGFFENLAQPIKEMFKPTINAHPESLGLIGPEYMGRAGRTPPASLSGNLALSTSNLVPEPEAPDSVKIYARDAIMGFKDLMGLIGFTYGAGFDEVTGGQGFLGTDAIYESSGRIWSQKRSYWDQELGGMFGLNEFYRRLNPSRDYGTDYIGSGIRNTQPTWMPGKYQYGDPYAAVALGEQRMPGIGYETLHPELRGVDYENYPDIHKLNILQDVSRGSLEYLRALKNIEGAAAAGDLSGDTLNMYEGIMRREEQIVSEEAGGRFDLGDKGPLSAYWLGVKKTLRASPTEHLFPLSPAHKLMGPVDPMGEYKSNILLDSSFKDWASPYSDYIKPAINRIMDAATLGHFVPAEAREGWAIDDYFNRLQYEKNKILDRQSQEAYERGDIEASSYIRSGKRTTTYDVGPFADLEEQAGTLMQKEKKFFRAFAAVTDAHERGEILASTNSTMGTMLQGQWAKQEMMANGDFDALAAISKKARTIGEEYNVTSADMPGEDFTGYAPGVNLNAFKVKVVSQLGKNIRDHNLWKEDERQARYLDALTNVPSSPLDIFHSKSAEREKEDVQRYLNSIGMTDAHISAIPISGNSLIHFQGAANNSDRLKQLMRDEGYNTY